jgi:hypothetical protein
VVMRRRLRWDMAALPCFRSFPRVAAQVKERARSVDLSDAMFPIPRGKTCRGGWGERERSFRRATW